MRVLPLALLSLLLLAPPAAAQAPTSQDTSGVLDAYMKAEQPSYSWKVKETLTEGGVMVYKLALTSSGHALHQKIVPAANKRYREFVSCLSHEELVGLRSSMEKLIAQAGNLRG